MKLLPFAFASFTEEGMMPKSVKNAKDPRVAAEEMKAEQEEIYSQSALEEVWRTTDDGILKRIEEWIYFDKAVRVGFMCVGSKEVAACHIDELEATKRALLSESFMERIDALLAKVKQEIKDWNPPVDECEQGEEDR